MTKKRVYIVPHSHWDREWYFTIEDSNLLLAENLDHLIELLEENSDFHGYIFDAQISIVDEYLKVRPMNAERLRELVTKRRIFVGPWYTQADSLLVHKESLIRNLLYGVKGAKEMGHSLNVGYLPDIFGQNQYLPSIFKGFGIENSILQRGIYTDELDENTNFLWESPDGEKIPANLIPLGYGPGKFLSSDEEFYEGRLLPMLDKLNKMNRDSSHLLLPSGGDQVLVRDHFPTTVKELNKKGSEYEFVLSDYETFMKDTWENSNFTHTVKGELIGTESARIHSTIGSQRYDLKQLNDRVEHKIINQLEPLAVIGQSLGLRYPQEWLDVMWKQLFDVHAHDSIGGCNSDDTNHDIKQRLIKVERQADGLMNLLKKQMTKAVQNHVQNEEIVVFWNTQPKTYKGFLEAVLFTRSPHVGIHSIEGEAKDITFIDQEYLSGGKKIVVTAEGDKEVEIPGYYRTRVLIHDTKLPALGYSTFYVRENEKGESLQAASQNYINNNAYTVTFKDGTLSLKENSSGLTIEDFIQFEDTADAGDSYDYSPLEGDAPILTGAAEVLSVVHSNVMDKLTVRHSLNLPKDLESRKQHKAEVLLTIDTEIELREGESYVRMKHVIDNKVKDHRVRAVIKSPASQPDLSFSDQGYSLIQRPVVNKRMEDWREKGYKEAPVPIYKVEQFAGILNENGSLMAFTKGIKEYEVSGNHLSLTLFRSVGLLGRDDLLWRPGRASGINNKVVTTPDAQMQTEMTFEYALQLSSNKLSENELFTTADHYRERYISYHWQDLNTFEERLDRFEIPYPINSLPAQYSLAEVTGDLFVSSIKKSHNDNSWIIRLFNPDHQPKKVEISTTGKTRLVDLKEDPIEGDYVVQAKSFQTIQLSKEAHNE
ncbi:glycoside hydrolase family 38 C-terminal domain-containing protein [Halobacillus sp. Marseille-Q1614]|uniref:glycoside hydrolase family 38 N-terminal domain-containing protein n=1 Tax=Halobacillus sp. Marseille-Q1614 TaxID=2709134 RepID=UPI0015701329|nr:glycoside hydrolase family 38 C-terminal domain-containing protein [Halobacillus sp. Marseille-Q1614]